MMGESRVQKFRKNIQLILVFWFLCFGFILIGGAWYAGQSEAVSSAQEAMLMGVLMVVVAIIAGAVIGKKIAKPTEYLAQTILHISPAEHLVKPPNLADVGVGKELVQSLSRQIFDFATVAQNSSSQTAMLPASLFDQLPVPILGLDEKNNITVANKRAKEALGNDKLLGLAVDNAISLKMQDDTDMQAWLKEVSEKGLNDYRQWQKVEVKSSAGEGSGYFDIAASFNKHSSSGVATLIAMYDHSDAYNQETASLGFVSLAVHEMRTPLTIMRGYIEAFQEELGSNVTPQLKQDLQRMNASAESLSSFVSNILNVARINQGELSLKLQEDNWNKVLPQIVDNLRNRAGVYDKTIELRMQPDMPKVAIDRMTISEVITNLIDNAIKYSDEGSNNIIVVSQLNSEGHVETTVQDHGIGIPTSVIPNLFSKFYRNHRTRSSVGGTGLGLFLSKAIVTAHNGHIWVRSKENEGSTFGFTILPYDQLAQNLQTVNNENIVRSSHGWIKNHSLQRR